MDKMFNQIYQNLQRLTGLHRQLLEAVRSERDALTQAHIELIKKTSDNKKALIEEIYQAESQRLKLIGELAIEWKKPLRELTLPNIITDLQVREPKHAEQLRSTYNALTVLIQRITEQNQDNQKLIEASLHHIHQMKQNVFGEASAKTNTYTSHGQRSTGVHAHRTISKEA